MFKDKTLRYAKQEYDVVVQFGHNILKTHRCIEAMSVLNIFSDIMNQALLIRPTHTQFVFAFVCVEKKVLT